MSNKPRPENASGPNGLRGGIKQYSTKTTTGPWLEEIGGPQFYKRGFTTVDFETEAQHQQKGALFEKQRLYGSGLPLDPVILENHKANENDTSHWQSVSQASTISLEKKKVNFIWLLVYQQYKFCWCCNSYCVFVTALMLNIFYIERFSNFFLSLRKYTNLFLARSWKNTEKLGLLIQKSVDLCGSRQNLDWLAMQPTESSKPLQ